MKIDKDDVETIAAGLKVDTKLTYEELVSLANQYNATSPNIDDMSDWDTWYIIVEDLIYNHLNKG